MFMSNLKSNEESALEPAAVQSPPRVEPWIPTVSMVIPPEPEFLGLRLMVGLEVVLQLALDPVAVEIPICIVFKE